MPNVIIEKSRKQSNEQKYKDIGNAFISYKDGYFDNNSEEHETKIITRCKVCLRAVNVDNIGRNGKVVER